jgi:adenylate cyclase
MRKLFYFLSVLLFFFSSSEAQNMDLIKQYEQEATGATDDKVRVDALNKLVAEYLNTAGGDEAFWQKVLKYAKDAQNLSDRIKYKKGLAESYINLAACYRKLDIPLKAKQYDFLAQKARSDLAEENERLAKEEEQKRKEKEAELQKEKDELARKQSEMKAKQEENERLAKEGKISKEEAEKRAKEISRQQEIVNAKQHQLSTAKQTIEQQSETIKQKDVVIVHSMEAMDSLEMLNKIAEQKLEIVELENENHRKEKIIYIGFAVLGIALAGVMTLLFVYQRRTSKILASKNKIIEEEKRRSNELLLNILPLELANELKETGSAEPRNYDFVTVLFTDFKDFTKVSENLSAKDLVDEIDYCFSAFDDIISRYDIEKIKTIGDAYLCAGGVPVAETHNPAKVVKAALEIQRFMYRLRKEREGTGKPTFEIRIGIHTGPLVAGVVGSKKFGYDIWGDTVNTAARMEQNSEYGKVNISDATYQEVKNNFICTSRGKLYDKTSKKEIEMYFVEKEV